MPVSVVKRDGTIQKSRVKELFVFDGLGKVKVQEVQAGDICAFTGIEGFEIGDTVADFENPEGMPNMHIDEPTMSMLFTINNSPFYAKEGKFVTSRHIKERLEKELEKNLALRLGETGSADSFMVFGRGVLHFERDGMVGLPDLARHLGVGVGGLEEALFRTCPEGHGHQDSEQRAAHRAPREQLIGRHALPVAFELHDTSVQHQQRDGLVLAGPFRRSVECGRIDAELPGRCARKELARRALDGGDRLVEPLGPFRGVGQLHDREHALPERPVGRHHADFEVLQLAFAFEQTMPPLWPSIAG